MDVFAEKKYQGNQLAVVLDAKKLPSDEMQQIAQEMNYSETTFILSKGKQSTGYPVRIFTPKEEVPFAGHPTLGTAYIIAHKIEKKSKKPIVLNLKVGKIPVELAKDILWMKQKPPTFGCLYDPESIASCLNLNEEDIDTKFPVQEVSTGIPFLILPLRNLDALKRAKVDTEKFFELVKCNDANAILLFCPETYNKENDLCVRVFADYYGVPEDPATGSGNGCLAGYLVRYRYLEKDSIDIRVEQGYEIDRPSLILLKAEEKEEFIDIYVGGRVIMVAQGELVDK